MGSGEDTYVSVSSRFRSERRSVPNTEDQSTGLDVVLLTNFMCGS